LSLLASFLPTPPFVKEESQFLGKTKQHDNTHAYEVIKGAFLSQRGAIYVAAITN
jgi:hypothetical protein